jgi:hypothetical protein
MSATTVPIPPRSDPTRPRRQAVPRRPATPPREGTSPAPPARHGRGGRVLFEVPFTSAMTDAELSRLARMFDLSTHMYPKQRPNPTSPGVARLDHFSGLYLERGNAEGEWVLEARTWGRPAPESVHEWHLLAAQAAHQLDPSVTMPERLPTPPVQFVARPVEEVQNRRFAAFRRHLVGLS